MPEKEPQKRHLKLVHGKGEPRADYPEGRKVTDEEIKAEAARAAIRLVQEGEQPLPREISLEDPAPEIDTGRPIVRERYNEIFKPKPPKAS